MLRFAGWLRSERPADALWTWRTDVEDQTALNELLPDITDISDKTLLDNKRRSSHALT